MKLQVQMLYMMRNNAYQWWAIKLSWSFLKANTKSNKIVFLFPGDSVGKESACNETDLSSIPGLGRSPGDGNGYLHQCSGLENSMDYSPWGSQRVGHDWATFTFTIDSVYTDLGQEKKDHTTYGDYTDLAHKKRSLICPSEYSLFTYREYSHDFHEQEARIVWCLCHRHSLSPSSLLQTSTLAYTLRAGSTGYWFS